MVFVHKKPRTGRLVATQFGVSCVAYWWANKDFLLALRVYMFFEPYNTIVVCFPVLLHSHVQSHCCCPLLCLSSHYQLSLS